MNRPGPTPLHVRIDSGPVQVVTASPATLGRTPDNTVTLNNPLVSRTHLGFEWGPDGWIVADRGSTNGFFSGGAKVTRLAIRGPVVIRVGDAALGPVVEITPAPAAAPSRPVPAQQPPASRPMPAQPPGMPSRPTPAQQAPPSRPMPAQPPSQPMPAQPPSRPVPAQQRPPATTPQPSQPPAPQPPHPPVRPAGGMRPAAPAFGKLPDAPHLAALHNNASAIFEVPGDLRGGRESIALSGVKSIGRTPENDIVVSDVLASRRHARLTANGQGLLIEDLGSVNGTFVNGQRIRRQPLREGDVVTIGNSDFVVSEGNLIRGRAKAMVSGGLEVDGIGLTVEGGKVLLNDISFQAGPGTLTAIIGPSGAGKSTMSKIAAGLNSPTVGRVSFEGRGVHDEYEALRNRIGMVPQDDVLHSKLTVRQALRYAAELRLPADLSTHDRDQVIDGVLAELSLTEHAQTRIDKLSGGQRKRASVAMELLTGPSLLILDEPTSGLDPALDRQVMKTLRDLADAGRVVLVVTHSVAHLEICDQVLLLAPGGKTAYCGDPKLKKAELGTDDWAEIFETVTAHPDQVWANYRQRHPHQTAPQAPPPAGPPVVVSQASSGRQLSTVSRRQWRLIFADRGYLVFLILLPIVLGLLTMVIPGGEGFGLRAQMPGGGTPGAPPKDPTEPLQILVVLIIGAAFMGAALTVRDLVGERAIFERERAVGLRPGAYLSAKVLVFGVLAVVQAAIMVGLCYGVRAMPTAEDITPPGQDPPSIPPALTLFLAVAALAVVSALIGLAISAAVRSNEQTMPPLVIVVMVQLVFCGGLFPIAAQGAKQLSWIFPSYWGYANGAQAVNLPATAYAPQVRPSEKNAGDPNAPILYSMWEPTLAHALISYGVLALMSILLLGFIYSRLRLKKH
ncbi:ATP-binding cassette domain-containing protein [Gordonia sp. PP30]|uniref:ATP-binding cassette domain-containing protein n=1 Tax=Gordonia sp. PP30 TaxID=2935861 RepID=UPI001FFF0370|nr:FHA domain-containing protein [Gordonia sp. PP30]UQE76747.1 ATP-binding cassette domain-containing protein [Gordonia sp. PP30]